MKNMTLENIAAACNGVYYGPEEKKNFCITSVTMDSRTIEEGGLFAAIAGERVDGHRFIPQVIENGAGAVLSEKLPADAGSEGFPTIVVPSTEEALREIAEYYLKQLNIPVIGIVGSVGKTSTKEMTAAVLSQKYRVLKTEGNFNNELGVPLTVFRLREEDEIAVLEMGISNFGEMSVLAKITRPDTVIMTNIGTAHLEFLGTRDGILKAKTEVFEFMKENGHIILNGDDDKLSLVEQPKGIAPVRFGIGEKGFSHENTIWADNVVKHGMHGVSCTIHTPQGSFSCMIPSPGRHMVYNALAGAAAGLAYGLTLEEIESGIESYESIKGRFHIVETDLYTIVDDCYNASPASMEASLGILKDADGRRVAILGDMGELGSDEVLLHAGVGRFAAECGIDALYCAGPLSKNIADTAASLNDKMEIRHYQDLGALLKALPLLLRKGDTILIKASHFMQFDKIVAELRD